MAKENAMVRERDVRAMLELMGQVAELPTAVQRLEHAVAGVAKLVGAEFAYSTRLRSDGPRQKVQPYAIVSRGWTDEQLAEGIRVASFDPFHDYVNDDMHVQGPRQGWPFAFVTQRQDTTRLRKRADASAEFVEVMGGDIGMAVLHPCAAEGHFAALALVREGQAGGFTERDIQIARLMWGALHFLHRAPLAAVEQKLWGARLPPRLTQVLEALKKGLSAKQIAYRLDISVHTVNDYIKDLYRRFGVSGRSELLALWIHQQHQQHQHQHQQHGS